MAKNNRQRTYYNNNGSSKTKSGWKGVIAAFTASALILGAAAGVMGYGTDGFKDWSFNNFVHKEKVTAPPESNNNGGAIVSDNVESNGISLTSARVAVEDYADYGIAPQAADSVFNLSVTYVPENTTFQQTTYTVAFKNPKSEWANGKNVTDYATVTQSAEGSKYAQLTILKPFSEQIIVTARSDRNSSIYVTTTVDYVCTSLSIDIYNSGKVFDADEDIYVKPIVWFNGTIVPESVGNVWFVMNLYGTFVNVMKSYGFDVPRYFVYQLNEDDLYEENSFLSFDTIVRRVGNYSSLNSEERKRYDAALGQCYGGARHGEDVAEYGFTYKRVLNGVVYSEAEDYADVCGSCFYASVNFAAAFEIEATGINKNNGNIIAG